jgi:hypothetical protein
VKSKDSELNGSNNLKCAGKTAWFSVMFDGHKEALVTIAKLSKVTYY